MLFRTAPWPMWHTPTLARLRRTAIPHQPRQIHRIEASQTERVHAGQEFRIQFQQPPRPWEHRGSIPCELDTLTVDAEAMRGCKAVVPISIGEKLDRLQAELASILAQHKELQASLRNIKESVAGFEELWTGGDCDWGSSHEAELQLLHSQHDNLEAKLQHVGVAKSSSEKRLASYQSHGREARVADISELLEGLAWNKTQPFQELRDVVESVIECAYMEFSGKPLLEQLEGWTPLERAQVMLVASCLGYKRLVSECAQHLSLLLLTAEEAAVCDVLRLAIQTQSAPALAELRAILELWMRDNAGPNLSRRALEHVAWRMDFAVRDERRVPVDAPAADHPPHGVAYGFSVSSQGLDWLSSASVEHAGCDPGSVLLPAFVNGFNQEADAYAVQKPSPVGQLDVPPRFYSQPASYANCMLSEARSGDLAPRQAQQHLVSHYMESLERAAEEARADQDIPISDHLNSLIDVYLPPAYMLHDHEHVSMSSGETFLRVACWLLNPADPRLPTPAWTLTMDPGAGNPIERWHPSEGVWPSSFMAIRHSAPGMAIEGILDSSSVMLIESFEVPHSVVGPGKDAELSELLVRFYPVNGGVGNKAAPALFGGMLDSARVHAVATRLPPQLKRLYQKVLSTRQDL